MGLCFPDSIFSNVQMAHSLSVEIMGPIHCTPVIIEDRSRKRNIEKVEIRDDVVKQLSMFYTFVGCLDLSFAG